MATLTRISSLSSSGCLRWTRRSDRRSSTASDLLADPNPGPNPDTNPDANPDTKPGPDLASSPKLIPSPESQPWKPSASPSLGQGRHQPRAGYAWRGRRRLRSRRGAQAWPHHFGGRSIWRCMALYGAVWALDGDPCVGCERRPAVWLWVCLGGRRERGGNGAARGGKGEGRVRGFGG
jgi:hypothetical protein